jgi:hypothetical protein
MEEPYLLPEVTKLKPWVSMATPVRWTCSSTYQLIKEDFPAEWFPEGDNYCDITDIEPAENGSKSQLDRMNSK